MPTPLANTSGMSSRSWELVQALHALHPNAPANIGAGDVGRQIQIQELSTERRSARIARGGAAARPVEREVGLGELGVRVSLCTLTDGGSRLVHLHPAANNEIGHRAQRVGEDGVAAVHASNNAGVVFADDIVRALLAGGRPVALGGVVAGRTLVAGDPSALEHREREAREPTHVGPVESLTRGGTNLIVVCNLDVWELFIHVVLELVDDYS